MKPWMGDVILDAWDSSSTKSDRGSVAGALRGVMCSLHEWSRENFGSVKRQLEELRRTLSDMQKETNAASREQAKKVAREMNELLYREEMMWLQRSMISWIREGDKNTKFFH